MLENTNTHLRGESVNHIPLGISNGMSNLTNNVSTESPCNQTTTKLKNSRNMHTIIGIAIAFHVSCGFGFLAIYGNEFIFWNMKKH